MSKAYGLVVVVLLVGHLSVWGQEAAEAPKVTPPPEGIFERFRERDRQAASLFYKKYVSAGGMPVLAGETIADEALLRTHHIVSRMLAGRPDVLGAMVQNRTRLIIIGKDQVYTDMPEYSQTSNPEFMNERVRGTGGLDVTSFGEENLLNLALDRYDDESIAVHEFCHTIDAALSRVDREWRQRLQQTYRDALAKGLWKNSYAATNPAEYWAEICQSYFDCNRINNWNHVGIASREQLQAYDPVGYALVRDTFRLTPANDWRYRPVQTQPSVMMPPARFKVDPYYTKFTYAREFPVLGSKHVSDEALFKANDVIRKLCTYRHDVLKVLINDGGRMVILGRNEQLRDLPEFAGKRDTAAADACRLVDYSPETKILVVPEENVLGLPGDPFAGQCLVVATMARAAYRAVAARPVDPEFDQRRNKQQYELRVKRLDEEFGKRVDKLLASAREKGLWSGTPAARDAAEYWVAGVCAYFDAAGNDWAPHGADRPIMTREALQNYDKELYDLVDETMAYRGRPDWRRRGILPRSFQ